MLSAHALVTDGVPAVGDVHALTGLDLDLLAFAGFPGVGSTSLARMQ